VPPADVPGSEPAPFSSQARPASPAGPASAGPQRGPSPAGDDAAQSAITGASILVVDDNEQNLELLVAYLEDLGCEIRTARDGPDALEEVARSRPDLILLDVMMPRMSGFQVCQRLKRSSVTSTIPILIVTALNEVSDVERAVEIGADDFLTKPVNRVELLTRVRSLVRVSMLQKRLHTTLEELRRLGGAEPQGGTGASAT
jgi:two-component system cell cycle response regulator